VTQEVVYGRIVQVHTGDGQTGLGEVVVPPTLSVDERQQLIADEPLYLSSLAGKEVDGLIQLAQELCGRGRSWSSIAFGLETAGYDLLGKAGGLPVFDVLGGRLGEGVDDYFSISESTIEKIRKRLAIAGSERKVIQLKLGIGSPGDDAEQVSAALSNMADWQILLADANGGWSVDTACEIISCFNDPRIVREEACSTYDENAEVARRTGQPVMVDQCVKEAGLARKAVDDQLVSSLCIKPAFLGGLTVARDIRDYCVSSGMKMRIDGPWCGDIATAAILHLAVGALPDLLIAGCDLREPLVRELDLKGVIKFDGCCVGPPPGPGLGISLTDNVMGDPDAIFSIR
jgi:L-alanine-DL-glutamate epimerase-like enolase superfamily enzyme